MQEELPGGGGAAMRKRHRANRAARGGGLVSTFFQANNVAGSSRTLADLQLDGAAGSGAAGEEVKPEEGLRQLLQALPERHAAEKAELRRRLHSQFGRWWAQLRAGNSLLLFGFGSKYELLSRFAREQTGDGASLAVNGLHPGLSAKQVCAGCACGLDRAGAGGLLMLAAIGQPPMHSPPHPCCTQPPPAVAAFSTTAFNQPPSPVFLPPSFLPPSFPPPSSHPADLDVGDGRPQRHQGFRLPRLLQG